MVEAFVNVSVWALLKPIRVNLFSFCMLSGALCCLHKGPLAQPNPYSDWDLALPTLDGKPFIMKLVITKSKQDGLF